MTGVLHHDTLLLVGLPRLGRAQGSQTVDRRAGALGLDEGGLVQADGSDGVELGVAAAQVEVALPLRRVGRLDGAVLVRGAVLDAAQVQTLPTHKSTHITISAYAFLPERSNIGTWPRGTHRVLGAEAGLELGVEGELAAVGGVGAGHGDVDDAGDHHAHTRASADVGRRDHAGAHVGVIRAVAVAVEARGHRARGEHLAALGAAEGVHDLDPRLVGRRGEVGVGRGVVEGGQGRLAGRLVLQAGGRKVLR